MTPRHRLSVSLPGLLLLLACGPTPSGDDVGVYLRDVGARDRATADSAAVDAGAADRLAPDSASVDSTSADHAAPDLGQPDTASAPDSAVADTRPVDSGPPDAYLYYGPYAATGLPRVINDATVSGTAVTTVALNVPQSLNVDFADVHVEIAHEDVRDLWVQLVPPVGDANTLYDGASCSSSCPTSLVLDQRIQIYDATQGNWVLRISDRYQSHVGTLQAYTLNFIP